MFGFLSTIVDKLVCWIETAGMTVANMTIAGVADALVWIFLLLPNMPAEIPMPEYVQMGLDSADYYVPLSFVVTLLGTTATLILAIWAVKIPLRFVRASQ